MITIYTRSYHDQLYEMMREFIPEFVPCKRFTGFNDWQDARTFLEAVIFECDGYAVICDEDCFIYNFDSIFGIVQHMRDNYFTHAGVPDAGVIPHRNFHWTTLNPFFNIIDCVTLKSCNVFGKINKPDFIDRNAGEEPFADFYLHLYKVGRPLWLNASTEADGISTNVKDHTGKTFALHTWYARDFESEEHHTRILNVYEQAKRAAAEVGLYRSF